MAKRRAAGKTFNTQRSATFFNMGIISFFIEKFSPRRTPRKISQSIYDFRIPSIDGKLVDFSRFKGKYLLIVNTASRCGYTPQYAELQKLHEQYGNSVTVLGFPANNFMWQEPGDNETISSFCELNYGVTFQMFTKISVKGKDQHPLYQWLEIKTGRRPSWNFCKYLIDEHGEEVLFYPSSVSPLDRSIIEKIRL